MADGAHDRFEGLVSRRNSVATTERHGLRERAIHLSPSCAPCPSSPNNTAHPPERLDRPVCADAHRVVGARMLQRIRAQPSSSASPMRALRAPGWSRAGTRSRTGPLRRRAARRACAAGQSLRPAEPLAGQDHCLPHPETVAFGPARAPVLCALATIPDSVLPINAAAVGSPRTSDSRHAPCEAR